MIGHRKTRQSLYDFVRQGLSAEEQTAVEEHLQWCPECRMALTEIRAAVDLLRGEPCGPSDSLPDSYWQQFASAVMNRAVSEKKGIRRPPMVLHELWTLLLGNRRWAFAVGGVTAAVGLVLVLLRPAEVQLPGDPGAPRMIPAVQAHEPIDQFLHRSKVLLVGLDNMTPASGQSLDLSIERRISRDLVRETRALKHENLDPASAIVVRDLEKLFIEIANTGEPTLIPNVELIRSGIRQENILFRLRMAEAVRDSVRMMLARY